MGNTTIYKVVKNAYDAGRYSIDDMRLLVFTGRITVEQFKEITGEEYKLETKADEENEN